MIQSVKIDQKYFISSSNGRDLENINPTVWAKRVENYGAGEIILTSVNNEGLKNGFDINITRKVSRAVKIPVIAHGGAENLRIYMMLLKN